MKNLYLLLTLILLFSQFDMAQINSVSAYADYSIGLSKRLTITNADAVGGAVKIKFNIIGNFNAGIVGEYKLYSLNELDVLKSWGWQFWTDRYYNKIVSDLQADPNLSVEIGAVQKMDIIPLMLFAGYEIAVTDNFIIAPSAGLGIYFYTRRMFATENWSKNFPEANYVFTYSYRNFAPNKKGNPVFVNTNLDFEYKISDNTGIYSGINFNFIIPTENSMGYSAFPFENEISIKGGIIIFY